MECAWIWTFGIRAYCEIDYCINIVTNKSYDAQWYSTKCNTSYHHHLKIESAQWLIDVIAGFEYLKLWISSGFVQNDEVSRKLLSNDDS